MYYVNMRVAYIIIMMSSVKALVVTKSYKTRMLQLILYVASESFGSHNVLC